MPLDLSIVIVSFNAREDLERCLASLRETPPSCSHEIVVVDNASTDGSADTARRHAGVRVIEAGDNRGFAAANNIGIRSSTGANVLLLNCDTIVPAAAIDTLVAELLRHPDVAVAGPRIVDANGRAELSFGDMVGPMAQVRQKLRQRGDVDALTRLERYPDWVTGACLLVRRADAEAAGLLDEQYFMYLEDVEFCAAIRARGRRVLFTPKAQITHLRGRSSASAGAALRLYRRSLLTFYRKHHPLWLPLLRLYLALARADT
jgi:GT2 family glycosyltransferase